MLQGSLGTQTKVHGKLDAFYQGPLGPKETESHKTEHFICV